MGFGYLVLGFIVWLNPVYSGFTEWLAYTLILSGTTKLSPYGKGYKLASIVGTVGLILSFANLILFGADLLGFFDYRATAIYKYLMLALMIVTYAVRVCVFCGTFSITAYTGIENLKIRSVYCIILYSVIFAFDILQTTRIIPATSSGFAVIMFSQIAVGLIAFFLLFACLRMIVLESDEEPGDEKEEAPKLSWWQKIKKMSEEDNSEK
ncbi:MAG: hypothetical protein IJN63_07115 [Clostridia bacterium]|nr:hypothetical protein [Clostridia bacterium]